MLTLIAESKTMTPCDHTVSKDVYDSHRPVLEDICTPIVASLSQLEVNEISAETKISASLALRMKNMAMEFTDKSHGSAAIEAYTGVVFKAFDYNTLDKKARDATCTNVRIISSLYGWLRPDDIVKPYRLDFTSPAAPGGKAMSAFLKPSVTACLIDYLKNNKCTEVLDLLPGDASRCIDWNEVRKLASVTKADFKEVQSGGSIKTPNSNRLKTLRGRLLRLIVTENIATFAELKHVSSSSYMAVGVSSNGDIMINSVAD